MEDFLIQKMLSIWNCFLKKNILLGCWLLFTIDSVAHTMAQIREEYSSGKSWGEECYFKVCSVSKAGGTFHLAPIYASLPKRACFMPFSLSVCCMGPIYMKHESELRKTWICLFTCLSHTSVVGAGFDSYTISWGDLWHERKARLGDIRQCSAI